MAKDGTSLAERVDNLAFVLRFVEMATADSPSPVTPATFAGDRVFDAGYRPAEDRHFNLLAARLMRRDGSPGEVLARMTEPIVRWTITRGRGKLTRALVIADGPRVEGDADELRALWKQSVLNHAPLADLRWREFVACEGLESIAPGLCDAVGLLLDAHLSIIGVLGELQ